MSSPQKTFNFIHCDVFAARAYTGNSLAVIFDSADLSDDQMLSITQELRHFESIFLSDNDGQISAKVFDLFEELPFAGHPIIGAACALHRQSGNSADQHWTIHLQGGRQVEVSTLHQNGRYWGVLDQDRPDMIAQLENASSFAPLFNLSKTSDLPAEIISTGLKYLVIPVEHGLKEARITVPDLEERLHHLGAEFAYLFDVHSFEGRHWNNDGVMEDVATGSAAGVVGAYALKHGLVPANKSFVLKQGHFIGRPSEIIVTPYGDCDNVERVTVTGEVSFVGKGEVFEP